MDLRSRKLQEGQARELGISTPRGRVLDRWRRRPDIHRDARSQIGCPKREDGRPLRWIRRQGNRRSGNESRQANKSPAHHPFVATGRLPGYGYRGLDRVRRADREGSASGPCARVRRADGGDEVDFSHDSRAGRIRQRFLGRGVVEIHRRDERVVHDGGGRGTGLPSIFPSAPRPTTCTGGTGWATTCSRKVWFA